MPKAHLSGVRGPSAVIRVRDIRKSRWILVLFSGDKEPVGDVPRLQSWLKSFDLIMTLLCNQTDRRGRRSLHFRYTINAAPYAPPCLPLTRGVSRSDGGREHPIQCDLSHRNHSLFTFHYSFITADEQSSPLRIPDKKDTLCRVSLLYYSKILYGSQPYSLIYSISRLFCSTYIAAYSLAAALRSSVSLDITLVASPEYPLQNSFTSSP